jgi:hypothetical protein
VNAKAQADPVELRLADPLVDYRGQGGGIGYVGPDVPIEVLLASGRPFGHLPWVAEAPTDQADGWLESSFPYWARSILEQWHDGVFDALDSVVFSRADDASQRLYYYVAELRRSGKLGGPAPVVFDIALIARESSLAHTEAAIVELMRTLDVGAGQLPAAIERASELRRRFAVIAREREGSGSFYERLGRAALFTDPSRWLDKVALPKTAAAAPRIVLAGSVPPDERLHRAVEAGGANVIAEVHVLAPYRAVADLNQDEPIVRALARQLRQASTAPRAFVDRAQRIVEQARAARADAVILWLTREDEGLAWSVPAQRRALEAVGIPALILPASRWRGDDGALDAIAKFCEEHSRATA